MRNELLCGDARELARTLPDESVSMICTSPPYWNLRDYQTASWEGGDTDCDHVKDRSIGISSSTLGGGKGTTNHQQEASYRDICGKCGAIRVDKQMGLEQSPQEYVAGMVDLFRELRRALHRTGTLWLNLGDSFCDKQLQGIPWRVALALQADGWVLRSDVIWAKKSPMPESVTDRPTKSHEYLFMLSKNAQYFYDADAIKEKNTWPDHNRFGNKNAAARLVDKLTGNMAPDASEHTDRTGRNRRSVWTLGPEPYPAAHFATFPRSLVRPCILAGTSAYGNCGNCGSPWMRVVERTGEWRAQHDRPAKHNGDVYRTNPGGGLKGPNTTTETQFVGWQPSCECFGHFEKREIPEDRQWMIDEGITTKEITIYVPDGPQPEPVPAIVLDPFIGSGTTAAVAIETGRDWLGFELNPDYIELARERIFGTQPALFAQGIAT